MKALNESPQFSEYMGQLNRQVGTRKRSMVMKTSDRFLVKFALVSLAVLLVKLGAEYTFQEFKYYYLCNFAEKNSTGENLCQHQQLKYRTK